MELQAQDNNRINIVFNYVKDHFQEPILLDEVSELVSMTSPSFCRYSKKITNKTFTTFVNEYRLVHASKLLAEKPMSITEICFESGFNNFSHFNKQLQLLTLLFATTVISAQTVKISASEPDANIIINGANVATGSYKLSMDKKDCYKIKVEKAGFLKYESTVCGKKAGPEAPSSLYFEMKKDDAEEASIKTDQANVDFQIEVNKDLDITEAWKLTTQIVTDYFDAIEVSDKETSYLRTAWSVQSFQQNTIRTRLIIKLSKSDPLTFKVKLNSEYSGVHGTSVKADEQFRDWDRILRKYKNVVSDFSNRLTKK